VVIFAGQGTLDAAGTLATLVDRRPALVATTVSARGVLPESHPWSLAYDFLACSVAETNRLLEEADFVLVLGCRTSHNGTGGFRIRLPEDRTAQVDLDPEVLGANYAPRWIVRARTETVLEALLARLGDTPAPSQWTAADAAAWRQRLREKSLPNPPEPRFPGTASGTAAEFFQALREWLSLDAIVVTDSGQHQIMARCHLRVESPRGLLVPSDYQSMGFGLPAAIGARLAAPDRQVVALLGDGGMRMVGLELAIAVREGIDVVAIVFNDGYLGQIRMQELSSASGEAAMALATLDFEALAAATGADYTCIAADARGVLASLPGRGVTLLEVPLVDSAEIRSTRRRARLAHSAKRLAGPAGRSVLRRLFRRR
jgi:acetolactate synthase-1/2/3 large subunit